MIKIDESWKKITLKSIFKIEKCVGTKIDNLIDGKIPYVSRTSINNGVTRMCGNKDFINPKNTITIHAEWKENYCAFYQEEDYVTDGMIAFLSCEKLNKYNGLFIATILSKTKYSGKGLKESLNNLWIKLPILHNGQPNWEYMENYVKKIFLNEPHLVDLSKPFNETKTTLSANYWHKFKLNEIFEFPKIKKFSSRPKNSGDIAYITSRSVDQGVECYVSVPVNAKIRNVITISTNGACFDCFYHGEFISTSTDVEIIQSDLMNKFSAMFICTILKLEKKKYGYGRKSKNHLVNNTIIKLPAKKNNDKWEPDWEYMENYIKSLPFSYKLVDHQKNN